jgi:hypothetical protein
MGAIRYGLTSDEVTWVEDVLSNDDDSENAELMKYFVRGGLTQAQAEAVLLHRGEYLSNIYLKGQGPLHLSWRKLRC